MSVFYLTSHVDYTIEESDVDRLRLKHPDHAFILGGRGNVPAELKKEIVGYYGFFPPASFEEFPKLRWIHVPSAGIEAYLKSEEIASGRIILTNSRGVYGEPISSHILALFLSMQRQLHLLRDCQHERRWAPQMPLKEFLGSTVLILGMGDIGSTLAKKCHALGARVIGVNRSLWEKPDYVDEFYTVDKLDQVLPHADFIGLCLPGTPETVNILSRERLDRIKPGAYLVNIGRGGAIDQDALYDVLASGRLAGAGLDVTTPEPLPKDHPLWALPNCVITSHSSGRSPGNKMRSFGIFEENVDRFIGGERLKNGIDLSRMY
ncbi:dehydrogenase [Clostridia bacterium]|nr:dehydrogenase [Clostridia bacterium]